MSRRKGLFVRALLPLLLIPPSGLRAQQPPACEDVAGFHALDFWVSSWDVYVGDRQVGTNHIEKILNGCAIMEHWSAMDGGTGKSLFFYQPLTDTWKQVWVTGHATRTAGVKEKTMVARAETEVRFEGHVPVPGGEPVLDRTTLTLQPDGTVRQLIEVDLPGEGWRTMFEAIYRQSEP
jgi:hypothetical protein